MQLSTINLSVEVSLTGLFSTMIGIKGISHKAQVMDREMVVRRVSLQTMALKEGILLGRCHGPVTMPGMLISHCDGLPRQA